MIRFSVTILGSSSATPTSERNPTSQLVNHRDKLFMIDCGEGTQVTLRKMKIHFQRINHIFISHLHGDHFFGLIGLLSTFHLLGREKPLTVYGTTELKEVIDTLLRASQTSLVYPLKYRFVDPSLQETIYEDGHISVLTLPLLHRIPTCGFIFKEKLKPRKIKKSAIQNAAIPVDAYAVLQQGKDYQLKNGDLLRNKDYTTDPPEPVSYAYCTDTAFHEPLIPMLLGIKYLFHEATFIEKEVALAKEKYHSTAGQAATIAVRSGIKRLFLGHFSNRYKDLNILLEEAREIFPACDLAAEGNIIKLD